MFCWRVGTLASKFNLDIDRVYMNKWIWYTTDQADAYASHLYNVTSVRYI